mgnify:CR=1 FL=1
MLRVAITQAQIQLHKRGETRDTLDVRWGQMLSELNYLILPLMPSAMNSHAKFKHMQIDAIILSGGGNVDDGSPREQLEKSLLTYSAAHNIPLLGICRGMQMINDHQDGRLIKLPNHVKKRHDIFYSHDKNCIKRVVNSYHEYCITPASLGRNLEVLARAEDDTIECIKHVTYPWLGIMWHPEREKSFDTFDLSLIKNHLGG